jgi:MoxR-like ATPase
MSRDEIKDAAWVPGLYSTLRDAIGAVIIGQDDAIRLSFTTLLCSGHSLYEGVPGVAKTLLVRTIASTLGIRFGRIQCTPDLMPSDIIGTPIFYPNSG